MTEFLSAPAAKMFARHGFFTRLGGVSTGSYASLNCSLSGHDAPEAVLENRARAARALGADPARLVGLHQVHGIAVIRVTEPWRPGEGRRADAMVTDRAGIALGIVTADCAPVLFVDVENGIIGAAHAGWRGALAGVLEATISAMVGLGATRAKIAAAIGPCIAQNSYEVGPDLHGAVCARNPADDRYFAPGQRADRKMFDLPGYCAARLAAAGLADVTDIAADTCGRETEFFSYRRKTLAGGGPIGHQISLIALPGA